MMEEGTIKSTKEELQARLDKLGSTVSISAANYTTSISISTLEANLHQTLEIVQEVLLEPAFKDSDFERNKKQMLEGIVYQHQKLSWPLHKRLGCLFLFCLSNLMMVQRLNFKSALMMSKLYCNTILLRELR